MQLLLAWSKLSFQPWHKQDLLACFPKETLCTAIINIFLNPWPVSLKLGSQAAVSEIPSSYKVHQPYVWLGQWKWKEKQANLYETSESPARLRCCGWPAPGNLHNVFPSAWTQECPEEKQISVFPMSFFYSSMMNLHSLSNISLLEPAFAERWKKRINFVNVSSLS